MGDIKTPWTDAPVPTPDLGGQGVTSRGGDPNVDASGSNGLQPVWDNAPVPAMASTETSNSSGLPLQPARFEPTGTPPAPPDLTEHSVQTIDEK